MINCWDPGHIRYSHLDWKQSGAGCTSGVAAERIVAEGADSTAVSGGVVVVRKYAAGTAAVRRACAAAVWVAAAADAAGGTAARTVPAPRTRGGPVAADTACAGSG